MVSKKEIKPSFMQFLSGMSAQCLMHLGMMENPITRSSTVDLPNARYSIDLLEILRQKTAGNLTDEEDKYLSSAIADLKIRYSQVTEK